MAKKSRALPPLVDERVQLIKSSIATIKWPDGRVQKLPAIRGYQDPRVIEARAAGAHVTMKITLGPPLDD